MDTSDTAIVPAATPGALATGAATARTLADASISANTRAAYTSALAGFDRTGAPETDAGIAACIGALYDAGRAASSAAMMVAALRFRARLDGRPSPTGPAVERALAGFRRQARDRGRGQAPAMTADDLAAIVATARQPRQSRNGRGLESAAVADRRGTVDVAIAGLAFHAGLTPVGDRAGPGRRRGAGRLGSGRRAGPGPPEQDESGRERGRRADGEERPGRRDPDAGRAGAGAGCPPDSALRTDGRPAPAGRGGCGRHRPPPDRPLGTGRTRVRTHRTGSRHGIGHARRRMEDGPHGGALRGRRDRRTGSRGPLPL